MGGGGATDSLHNYSTITFNTHMPNTFLQHNPITTLHKLCNGLISLITFTHHSLLTILGSMGYARPHTHTDHTEHRPRTVIGP